MYRPIILTLGCLMILFGISGLWMMPRILHQKIEQKLQLKMGTKNMERFLRVPIPLTVKMYIFNVTNSDQVLQGLERPKFKEVGPFVYKQWRRREVTDFEDYNRLLKYKEIKTYLPEYNKPPTEESIREGWLDPATVNVTILNVPLLGALSKIAMMDENSIKRKIATKVIERLVQESGDKILVTKTASQVLFEGYKVKLLEAARSLVDTTLGFNFESPLPKNKFGFFHGKNDTWDRKTNGELVVYTGRNDTMHSFMLIDSWNEMKELQVWPNDTVAGNSCNRIKGSDGSQFLPGTTKNSILNIFSPLICTSIEIRYREETKFRDIPMLRFGPASHMFAAPKKNPSKACYCTISSKKQSTDTSSGAKTITDSRCYLDGIHDLSACQKGAPVAASWPHFLNADPLLASATGLEPVKEKHETYVDVEPMTGTVMRAAARAQMNAIVEQAALGIVDANTIGHMTPMVAPIFWLEEAARIDEKNANEFKGRLLNLVQKAFRSFVYAIIIGVILILLVIIQYWYIMCYKHSSKEASSERQTKNRLRKGANHHRASNMQLGSHAQLLAKGDGKQVSGEDDSTIGAGAALLGAAAVLVAGGPKKQRRKKREADYESEDDIMKQVLVSNEWSVGQATPSTGHSSGASESQLPTEGSCGGGEAVTIEEDSEGDQDTRREPEADKSDNEADKE